MLSRGRCLWCSLQGLCIWDSPGIRDSNWRLTKCVTGSTSLHFTEFCPSCIYLALFLRCCFISVLKAGRRQDKASLLVLTRRAQRSQPWPARHTSPGEQRWGPDLTAEPRVIKYPRLIRQCPEPAKVEEVVAALGSSLEKGLGQEEQRARTWLRITEQGWGGHSHRGEIHRTCVWDEQNPHVLKHLGHTHMAPWPMDCTWNRK